jgi:hypothetical protein
MSSSLKGFIITAAFITTWFLSNNAVQAQTCNTKDLNEYCTLSAQVLRSQCSATEGISYAVTFSAENKTNPKGLNINRTCEFSIQGVDGRVYLEDYGVGLIYDGYLGGLGFAFSCGYDDSGYNKCVRDGIEVQIPTLLDLTTGNYTHRSEFRVRYNVRTHRDNGQTQECWTDLAIPSTGSYMPGEPDICTTIGLDSYCTQPDYTCGLAQGSNDPNCPTNKDCCYSTWENPTACVNTECVPYEACKFPLINTGVECGDPGTDGLCEAAGGCWRYGIVDGQRTIIGVLDNHLCDEVSGTCEIAAGFECADPAGGCALPGQACGPSSPQRLGCCANVSCNPQSNGQYVCDLALYSVMDRIVYTGPIVNYEDLLKKITTLLIPIALGVFGIPLIIINGYKILTSQGDPKRVQEGKEGLTSAIIGLVFVLLAMSILRVILNTVFNAGI